MSLPKFTFLAVLSVLSLGFAQEYEADVDSAWIAKQNGGRTELNNGETNEPAPDCIGDGCNATYPAPLPQESTTLGPTVTADTPGDSSAPSSVKANDDENCVEGSGIGTDCADMDEQDADAYDRYIVENAAQYRARKEGFSRAVRIGLRIGGGVNKPFFQEKAGLWNPGYDANAGILTHLPIGNRGLAADLGLEFSYRHYEFETDNHYGEYKATIDIALFEIPLILKYQLDDEGFYFGLGGDMGLKLSGSSKFKQTIDTGKKIEKDSRNNTIPTALVEWGAVADVGYIFTKHFMLDLRVTQYFSNILNENIVAEKTLMKMDLNPMHFSLGLTFLL